MAIAPVLKTGVRKDLGVRIPRPPFYLISCQTTSYRSLITAPLSRGRFRLEIVRRRLYQDWRDTPCVLRTCAPSASRCGPPSGSSSRAPLNT